MGRKEGRIKKKTRKSWRRSTKINDKSYNRKKRKMKLKKGRLKVENERQENFTRKSISLSCRFSDRVLNWYDLLTLTAEKKNKYIESPYEFLRRYLPLCYP